MDPEYQGKILPLLYYYLFYEDSEKIFYFSTLCVITVVILYAALTWIVGLASYLQLRSKTAREEAEWKMRNRMDYFRFN